jgi:hypothetical protein
MATISLLSRIVSGVQRQVNLSSNTLWVADLQLNNSSGYTLAGTTSGHAGSSLIGDDNSYSHFTPASATIKGALTGIDSALGSIAGFANQTLSNLTSPTSVNQSLIPASAGSQVLGTAADYWGSSYIAALLDTSGVVSVDPFNRVLKDTAGTTQLSWTTAGVQLNNGPLNMNSHQINNLVMAGTPLSTDAASVGYVQAVLEGLSPKASVKAGTTAALPTVTYSNGTAGVGATLTATANGALTVDGYAVQLNDRILVKNQASALQNGIYYLSTLGTGGVPFVLTRTLDADTCQPASNPSVTSGIWTFIESTSTTLFNQGWMLTTADPITLGTTALNWSQFYAQGEYVFGNGFTVAGVNISVNLAASTALAFSGSAIAWQFDNSTIGVNGSNQAYVPNAGITKTQINTNVFDQATITGGAGTSASVAYAPAVNFTGTAGQTFAANTTYALRFGLSDHGETAGRLYAADITTSSFDLFWVVGFLPSGAGFTAGQSITVVQEGTMTLGSSDTNFAGADSGKPIYLQSGGINATTTAPSTTGQAVAAIGMVTSTTTFFVMIRSPYVY